MELNKALLDCMQALRRRLRDELALDIRLSQSDAVIALLGGCLQSSDEETRRLGQRLGAHLSRPARLCLSGWQATLRLAAPTLPGSRPFAAEAAPAGRPATALDQARDCTCHQVQNSSSASHRLALGS
jgi:hypothetical protein